MAVNPDGKESARSARDPGLIPGLGRSLEKGMAIHFSVLAWRIPWAEKTGEIQSMGSKRVGHDRATHTIPFKENIWIQENKSGSQIISNFSTN